MPVATKSNYDIDQAIALLDEAAARLTENDWFRKDWLFSVHGYPYPPAAPESVTLHVFRPHWFNQDKQGIHFETSLGEKQWKSGKIPIALHIFHTAEVPGTKIKRKVVTKPFIDSCHKKISTWPGYEFRAGLLGCQPFTKMLAFDFESFDSVVASEISRLCIELGPALDKSLAAALKKNG
ncbi:MAG: hypothetical protein K2X93_19440 [Candidatus Obscuribacterales bacterium]|nr:hypothetical protein [Candidatus Obscuribacterales bacterium]